MKIIVAFDFSEQDQIDRFIDDFKETPCWVKLGMEAYYRFGPELIEKIAKEHNVFLDLKLHDIPQTVHNALLNLFKLPISMVNVHALGGSEMLRQAREAKKKSNSQAELIAVTHLTSFSEVQVKKELGIHKSLNESALGLAGLAAHAGLDGIVSSVYESKIIKEAYGRDFKTICPGIRLAGNDHHDQKRVATPLEAKNEGCDYIVVGRAITESPSPVDTYQTILKEIQ